MFFSIFRLPLCAAALAAVLAAGATATAQSDPVTEEANRIAKAQQASARLVQEIGSVEGNLGVFTARTHDGVELIFAWFENKPAVLRWFNDDYHRKLLREARRTEDGIAAKYFGDHVGPILVVASVAYLDAPDSNAASMFDDPDAGAPLRFAVEYYTPLAGGAFFNTPFAPPEAASMVHGLRDIREQDSDCPCLATRPEYDGD